MKLPSVTNLTRPFTRKAALVEPALVEPVETDPVETETDELVVSTGSTTGAPAPVDPVETDPVETDPVETETDELVVSTGSTTETAVLTTAWPTEVLTPPNATYLQAPRPRQSVNQVREALFGETTAGELIADRVTAWFGDHLVLDRVSLDMAAGEVTALIGPSGCGKSTFLRILNRMHEMIPTASLAGEVRLDGRDIYDPNERITAARRQIGMIFQKPNPFPAMSIYENVISGLKLAGIRASREQKDILVEESLRKAALWEEVKDRLEQPGGGLSGGQQQRLCIARSLAVSPRVLLMDEPCSALDPTSTRRVEETIESLRGQVTIVIVTHNMQQAARVSSQCAFFLAAQNTPGVIVEHGDTEAMFNNPQDQRTADYVGGRFG